MATNYERGAQFERRVKDDLIQRGYQVARSGGSHGEADLIALRPGIVLYVQCKRNGKLAPVEWNLLLDAASKAGAMPILATPHNITGPRRKGIRCWRLTGPKDGSKRAQPYEPFDPAV